MRQKSSEFDCICFCIGHCQDVMPIPKQEESKCYVIYASSVLYSGPHPELVESGVCRCRCVRVAAIVSASREWRMAKGCPVSQEETWGRQKHKQTLLGSIQHTQT